MTIPASLFALTMEWRQGCSAAPAEPAETVAASAAAASFVHIDSSSLSSLPRTLAVCAGPGQPGPDAGRQSPEPAAAAPWNGMILQLRGPPDGPEPRFNRGSHHLRPLTKLARLLPRARHVPSTPQRIPHGPLHRSR